MIVEIIIWIRLVNAYLHKADSTARIYAMWLVIVINSYYPLKGQVLRDIYLSAATQMCPLWRHQMETFFALLAICAGNTPASGEFSAQRPVTRSFDALLWSVPE